MEKDEEDVLVENVISAYRLSWISFRDALFKILLIRREIVYEKNDTDAKET